MVASKLAVTSPAVPLPNAKDAAPNLEIPASPLKESTVPLGNCRELLKRAALVDVPATAGAVSVTCPEVDPVNAKTPLEVPAKPTVRVGAENVNWVLVRGAVAAPPPSTTPPDAKRAEDAQVDAEEK